MTTNDQISQDLLEMLADKRLATAIPNREVEISLRAKTYLLGFLHLLMQYVEGAEIQYCPSSFIIPLRRLLRKHHRDFDFIVRTSCWYNYSILPLTEGIREVFSEAGYLNLLNGFPDKFFVIDCPVSERRNIPIHCIFAHEIGHTLYKRYGVADRLSPSVSVDESVLERLISAFARQPVETRRGETGATAGEVVQEWRIEHALRSRLKIVISQWLEEVTADALAICLLGPAYFFAFVYFAGPFASMDNPTDKHPPDRMRIRFMCDMISAKGDGLAYDKVLDETAKEYIERWKVYTSQPSVTMLGAEDTLHSIAARAIEPVLKTIMKETKGITRRSRYTPNRFKRDVYLLYESLGHGIPPNEIIDDWEVGQYRIAEAEAILNAGWVYLISRDDRYARLLGVSDQWAVTNQLFDLVSKALEYAEIQRRWRQQR
jgi:hypothetical protein